MTRRLALAALLLLGLVSSGTAQSTGPSLSGTVADALGAPVAEANVALLRKSTMASGGQGLGILAQTKTDAAGRFSFGAVALQNEVAFPLETSVSLEYVVMKANRNFIVDRVEFSAPRQSNRIVSIDATIHAR